MQIIDPHKVFRLDKETGKLYWLEPAKYYQKHDREAGTIQISRGKPYRAIQVNGKKYKRAQIVFYMTTGRWPKPTVDHINGDSLDDRPSNLRQATRLQNARNRKIGKPGKELPMGVRKLGKRYQARIGVKGTQLYLGMFNTEKEAKAVYLVKRKEYYADFAG